MKTIYKERVKKRIVSKQTPTTTSIICGTQNPASMGATIYDLEGGGVGFTFTANQWHEGHAGFLHGGIISSILDEAMGRSNRVYDRDNKHMSVPYMTVEMTVNFLRAIPSGKQMWAYGRVDREDGRKHYNSAEIVDETGLVYATSKGFFLQVPGLDSTNVTEKRPQFSELTEDDLKFI